MAEDLQQFPESVPAPQARRLPEPPWVLGAWIGWGMGPGLLLAVVAVSWLTSLVASEPVGGLAVFSLLPLHCVSLLVTVGMLVSRGKFRSVPEFWLLVIYWVPVLVLLVTLFRMRRPDRLPTDEFISAWKGVVLVVAAAFPLIGGVRLAAGNRRKPATA